MDKRPWKTLDEEAAHLVELNQSEVPTIIRSYVFPDREGKEIRVVHVDSAAFPEDRVVPIKFSPDPQYRLFHPMFIAIVDANDPEALPLPEQWGAWSSARVIERPRRRRAAG